MRVSKLNVWKTDEIKLVPCWPQGVPSICFDFRFWSASEYYRIEILWVNDFLDTPTDLKDWRWLCWSQKVGGKCTGSQNMWSRADEVLGFRGGWHIDVAPEALW